MHLFRKDMPLFGPSRGHASAGRAEAAPFGRSEAGGPEVSAFALDNGLDVVVVPDDAELSDIGIGGYVAQAAADLKEQTESGGEGAAAASDALRLLYRYATAGERA